MASAEFSTNGANGDVSTIEADFDAMDYESLALQESGIKGSAPWTRPMSWREAASAATPSALTGSSLVEQASLAPDVFTLEDLKRILREAAGEEDGVEVDAGTLDTLFDELGYESLALLETGLRIEREFGIKLDDETMFEAATPRALIDVVNAHLARRW